MSTTNSSPPLAVHFVWHPCNNDDIYNVIMQFRKYITRDIDKPFSREINIPTFLYSSTDKKESPNTIPPKLANKDVVFLFTSKHTLVYPNWLEYISNLSKNSYYSIVPITVDDKGTNHSDSGTLKKANFIKASNWSKENYFEDAMLKLSHELYRYGLNDINADEVGKDSSIKLFLSHAKQGGIGVEHAESIKRFIDNSNMDNFFDTYDISAGFKFDKEIAEHLKKSTLVAIVSDAYSSRYWCQREVQIAKAEQIPIVVVNSLEDYEDRIFPAISNVPCVHISAEPLEEKNILRILIASLLETIRFKYSNALLMYYQNQGWIEPDAKTLSRPPEIQQVINALEEEGKATSNNSRLHFCYPEPPLYQEETVWTNYLNVIVSTPLWSSAEELPRPYRVGLSISDYLDSNYQNYHQHLDELKRLSQDLARHLLSRKHTLIYGGDLRDDGFTQFILDEAQVLKNRLQTDEFNVENHLAWPIYLTEDNIDFRAKYYGLLNVVEHDIPSDISSRIDDSDVFIAPNRPNNKYIWSRCLTTMREESIKNSDIRIFAGGKSKGYLGKMPGVLEEFLIAIKNDKPVYLAGGLGGLCKKLCDSIINHKIAVEFTEQWQLRNNDGYHELQEIASANSHDARYEDISHSILNLTITKLSSNSGLTQDEYTRLMTTPFVDEIIHLMLKGLKNIDPNHY